MLHQHHYHCNSSSRCKHCRCLLGCVSSLSIKEKESLRCNNGTSITCRGHPWLHPLLYGLRQTFRCGWPRAGCQLWSWHQQLSGDRMLRVGNMLRRDGQMLRQPLQAYGRLRQSTVRGGPHPGSGFPGVCVLGLDRVRVWHGPERYGGVLRQGPRKSDRRSGV
uniref:(northern house mosquito) hypothetical protein n=2 Tax=Culex pipiens TaxID=7175 RepID=A0A8D8AWZ5_CULPI